MRRKAGLQKRVSSIFEDWHVPGKREDAPEAPPEPEIVPKLSAPVEDEAVPADPVNDPVLENELSANEPPKPEFVPRQQTDDEDVPVVREATIVTGRKRYTIKYRIVAAVIIVLCLGFVGVTVNMLGTDVFSRSTSSEGLDVDVTVDDASLVRIDWPIPDKFPDQMRDIMRPARYGGSVQLAATYEDKVEIVVRGILFSKDDPSAIIGTQIVHIGDEVMGAAVIDITRQTVEFEKDGKQWTQNVERKTVGRYQGAGKNILLKGDYHGNTK
jgi:hypothetical protein